VSIGVRPAVVGRDLVRDVALGGPAGVGWAALAEDLSENVFPGHLRRGGSCRILWRVAYLFLLEPGVLVTLDTKDTPPSFTPPIDKI